MDKPSIICFLLLLYLSKLSADVRKFNPANTFINLTLHCGKIWVASVTYQKINVVNNTHRGKVNSVQKFVKVKSWLLRIFYMCSNNPFHGSFLCAQTIHLSFLIQLRVLSDSSSRQKMDDIFSSTNFSTKCELVFVLTQ